MYSTKRGQNKIVVEVGPEIRKKLHQKKLKIGWQNCNAAVYLVAMRCFRCSKFNHRHRECKGEETRPLCAGGHRLKECKASADQHKCMNCIIYNRHSKTGRTDENHLSLDINCPSMLAVLDKYRQNTINGAKPNTRRSKRNGPNLLNSTETLKCLQMNIQHSRVATTNLTQIIQHNIDIVFVQEPYIVHNRVAGFPKGLKIHTQGEGRIRAAILINNNEVDAITITQG